MITRVEITLGLLSMLGLIAITAIVGIAEFGDHGRMARADLGYDMRSIERGAQMFDEYCAPCHGFNAAGANCPPLDESSGLHAGGLTEGVAWRLEEVNWAKGDAYGYIYASIAAGKTVSTRPYRYPAQEDNAMAMPAWSQHYGGPLRDDQVADITNYVVNFRSYFPDGSDPDAREKACEFVLDSIATSNPNYLSDCYERVDRKPPKPEPTAAPKVEAIEDAADEDDESGTDSEDTSTDEDAENAADSDAEAETDEDIADEDKDAVTDEDEG
ncbi:MAG: c-type cytochrome [Deltaproteobacteria bacterium]|nr:c-type cytochrome [Deltaproteobacteria bacterium]